MSFENGVWRQLVGLCFSGRGDRPLHILGAGSVSSLECLSVTFKYVQYLLFSLSGPRHLIGFNLDFGIGQDKSGTFSFWAHKGSHFFQAFFLALYRAKKTIPQTTTLFPCSPSISAKPRFHLPPPLPFHLQLVTTSANLSPAQVYSSISSIIPAPALCSAVAETSVLPEHLLSAPSPLGQEHVSSMWQKHLIHCNIEFHRAAFSYVTRNI